MPYCPAAMFLESAHTVAMIKHSMDVFWKVVKHLNPGQTPIIAIDQPHCAISKQILWNWSDKYEEDKFITLFGGLHIEMAALKTLGDLLQDSGWVQALMHANITTPGTADSLWRAAYLSRTRRAHQVTVSASYILQRRVYDRYCLTCLGDGHNML